jgi:hypothetical protein
MARNAALVGASGQVIHSLMLGNQVYFVLNLCLIFRDGFGLSLVIHRRWITQAQSERAIWTERQERSVDIAR